MEEGYKTYHKMFAGLCSLSVELDVLMLDPDELMSNQIFVHVVVFFSISL